MRLSLFCWVLFAIAGTSCTRIVFDVPQPPDTPSLSAFPAKFQGSYLSPDSDKDTMYLRAQTVTFVNNGEREIPLYMLDQYPNITLKQGVLTDDDYPGHGDVPYEIVDSVLKYTITTYDILGLSDTVVVKEMDKYLVVNMKANDVEGGGWDVVIAHLDSNGDLVVSKPANLKTPDSKPENEHTGNIEDFKKIAPYERLSEDTYMFRTTKAQFKKLIDKDLFSEETTVRRVQ